MVGALSVVGARSLILVLNAWLGGYQSILKCMTPGKFNWFLHTMLFYHTKYVIFKQEMKKSDGDN